PSGPRHLMASSSPCCSALAANSEHTVWPATARSMASFSARTSLVTVAISISLAEAGEVGLAALAPGGSGLLVLGRPHALHLGPDEVGQDRVVVHVEGAVGQALAVPEAGRRGPLELLA